MLNSKDTLLLQRIKEDVSYNDWFFREAKHVKWFYPLKEKGYFEPKEISFDRNGNAFFWPVLNYLERISEQVSKFPEYGEKLIEILRDLVKFSKTQKRVNNYHVWWYCEKIFYNLPNNTIRENLPPDEFKDWLLIWSEHSLGTSPSLHDVGKNMLGKFLDDSKMIAYAETIVDVMTRLKRGDKRPSGFTRDEAVLIWDHYWIIESFKVNCQKISEKFPNSAIFRLADKLKTVLEATHEKSYVHIEISGIEMERYRISVSRIEQALHNVNGLDFISNNYECRVQKYSKNQKTEDEKAEFGLLGLHYLEPEILIHSFRFSLDRKEGFVSAIIDGLPKEVPWPNDDDFQEKIDTIHFNLFQDYSHVWLKSLEGGSALHAYHSNEVLAVAFRDVLIAKSEINSDQTEEILDSFLTDKYPFPIFKRFVLLCIKRNWQTYGKFLQKLFSSIPEPLAENDLEVELQEVLRLHNDKFDQNFKNELKRQIEKVPKYYKKEDERFSLHWKYKWLSPLKENEDFKSGYEEVTSKLGIDVNKPYEPDVKEFEAYIVVNKSPLSKNEILNMSISDFVNFLKEFKGTDDWGTPPYKGPNEEGMAEVLRDVAKTNPDKFTNEFEKFQETTSYYIFWIFWGLREAWINKIEIDWGKVFDFSMSYLNHPGDSFPMQTGLRNSNDHQYDMAIGGIVELIAEGCRKDENAFDPKYFEKVEKIFDTLFPLLKPETEQTIQNDAVTYALNTTVGKVINADILFSLRVGRALGKPKENWGIGRYERYFSVGIEAYIWFGSFLPQTQFLDKDYSDKKMEELAKRDPADFEWKMFMEGYLFWGEGYRYDDLYLRMRPHYWKALEHKILSEESDKRLINHICIGYLQGRESLVGKNTDGSESLFLRILNDVSEVRENNRLFELEDYFWSITPRVMKDDEEKTPSEVKDRILEFWRWTYENREFLKEKLRGDYFSFLGRLNMLTILLDKIDAEAEKWILLSAPHVERQYNSSFVLEYLTKYEDSESVKRVGKIFLKILENTTPIYQEEHIKLIVSRIYENGDPADADTICNIYGRRGANFLKDIWKKNQKR